MWLPAFKILKGLFALKGQFTAMNAQGKEVPYEGPYFATPQGKLFTGTGPTSTSVGLTPVFPEHEHNDNPGEGNKLFGENSYPTPSDYKTGYFTRYFLLDTRNDIITEVKKKTYKLTKDLKYIKSGEINWVIEKPVKDIFNQGYNYQGAASRNRAKVLKMSLSLPRIDKHITDYGKFADIESDVEGYNFEQLPAKEQERIIKKQSPSIQQHPLREIKPRFKQKKPRLTKIKNNLYTPGGRFKVKGSNEDYIGFYHVHPTKGAMEGSVHTENIHRKLIPYLNTPTNSGNTVSTSTTSGGGSSGMYNEGLNSNSDNPSEQGYTRNTTISTNNYY